MPLVKFHCAISKKRTGKEFKELHKWIDESAKEKGVNHRSSRHFYTKELLEEVKKKFGGSPAVSEWLFHLVLDNLNTYMTNEWKYNRGFNNFLRFGFFESGFIHSDESQLSEDNLDDEF